MRNTAKTDIGTQQNTAHRRKYLLAGMLGVAVAVCVVAVFASPMPANTRATSDNGVNAHARGTMDDLVIDRRVDAALQEQLRAEHERMLSEHDGRGGGVSPEAVTVMMSPGCTDSCATMIWRDSMTATVDMATALDYGSLCSCPVVVVYH